jgi:hypothetical protein
MNPVKSVITLTFGDQAENHAGMEQIGKMVKKGEGFNYSDLIEIQEKFKTLGAQTFLHNLKNDKSNLDAYVLIIRDGVNLIYKDLGLDLKIYNKDKLFDEQSKLDVDKKAFMKGRVVNKKARWNLCFDEKDSSPDYDNKKGRVISYRDVILTNILFESFPNYFGNKSKDLKGEGNYYYDITKCGIGYHGDSERRKVLAIRLGASMPLYYQWYYKSQRVEDRIKLDLNGGDIYLMDEKAVGTDWKLRNTYTLRHAAGCNKYIK